MLPGDDENDPNIHVEETLNFTLQESRPTESKDDLQRIPDWKLEGLHVKVTLMLEADKESNQHFLIGQLEDDEAIEDEDAHSEELADRLMTEMQLSGENPDEEIDKLLETLLDI